MIAARQFGVPSAARSFGASLFTGIPAASLSAILSANGIVLPSVGVTTDSSTTSNNGLATITAQTTLSVSTSDSTTPVGSPYLAATTVISSSIGNLNLGVGSTPVIGSTVSSVFSPSSTLSTSVATITTNSIVLPSTTAVSPTLISATTTTSQFYVVPATGSSTSRSSASRSSGTLPSSQSITALPIAATSSKQANHNHLAVILPVILGSLAALFLAGAVYLYRRRHRESVHSYAPAGAAVAHPSEKAAMSSGSTKSGSNVAWSSIGDEGLGGGTAIAVGTAAAAHSQDYHGAGHVNYGGLVVGGKSGATTHMAELESPLVGSAPSRLGPAGGAAELEGSSSGWAHYSTVGQSAPPHAPSRQATINDGIWELQTDHGRL